LLGYVSLFTREVSGLIYEHLYLPTAEVTIKYNKATKGYDKAKNTKKAKE